MIIGNLGIYIISNTIKNIDDIMIYTEALIRCNELSELAKQIVMIIKLYKLDEGEEIGGGRGWA